MRTITKTFRCDGCGFTDDNNHNWWSVHRIIYTPHTRAEGDYDLDYCERCVVAMGAVLVQRRTPRVRQTSQTPPEFT